MSTTAITDEEFFASENDLLSIFGLATADAPRIEDTILTPEHDARIEKIVQGALHEAVLKDTTAFFFKTFGVGLNGLAETFFSSLSALSKADKIDDPGQFSEIDLLPLTDDDDG